MTISETWLLPDGVADVLPEQAQVVETLRREALDFLAVRGYQLVYTPFIEYIESLSSLSESNQDLDLVTLITDQIIKDNPGKEGYDVFFADRNESKIVVLIIGIHQLKQIDKTTCDLFSNSQIKWPPYSTILYFDDSPKNNFIVAMSKK